MFRWILWEALDELTEKRVAIIAVQAAVFGLSHFPGIPGGWPGVAMASAYGLMLGHIRHRSDGLLVPTLNHAFTDITIILIVFNGAGII